MTERFTTSQKGRFRKLLVLAAESPFPGEQKAALAAAERLAQRFGMSLDEAARACREPGIGRTHGSAAGEGATHTGWTAPQPPPSWMANVYGAYAYEAAASRARQRHRESVERAQRREEEERRRARGWRSGIGRSSRRVPPKDFARTLILETRFSLEEISQITGVAMHDLIGLKLKLRPALG